MSRLIPRAIFILLIMTGGCTYDLTEVRLEPRDASVVVRIETTRGSATRASIYIDAGITEEGVPRTLMHEAVLLDGIAYTPTQRLEERRLYDILVSESADSFPIVLPTITGIAEVPPFVAVPLRVVAPDTVSNSAAGFMEIPVLGTEDNYESSQSSWNAILYVADTATPRLTVSGTHPIPSVLRVPTIHLSNEIQGGHVAVSGASVRIVSPEPPLEVVLQRTMNASVPFRLTH